MKVIGVFRKRGKFTDRQTNREVQYDNAMLVVTLSPAEFGKTVTPIDGETVELVKMSYEVYKAEEKRHGVSPVGMDIRLIYGKYSKVQGFDIL